MSTSRLSNIAEKLPPRSIYFLPLLLISLALLLYFPSLSTPFWGDDYVFLQQARASRLNAEPWWLAFYSPSELGFWRPLSMDTYFRWIETCLGANVFYAHIANFFYGYWLLQE